MDDDTCRAILQRVEAEMERYCRAVEKFRQILGIRQRHCQAYVSQRQCESTKSHAITQSFDCIELPILKKAG